MAMTPVEERPSCLQLTLGPILFNWPTEQWSDFYRRIADEAPVDRVCVGEVVCSKRLALRLDAISGVLERLERGGKEVVCATLALPIMPRELHAIREVIEAGYLVEANDISTIHLLAGRPHVVGPFLNVYNEDALLLHRELGATSICLSPELPLKQCLLIAAENPTVEVFAFGRAPLALSARCYHAHAHGLSKDSCQFICERDLDGMDVYSIDGQPFLAVNGIQTLGHGVTAAVAQVTSLRAAGIASLRLSPHACDMVRVAATFRDLIDAQIDPDEAQTILASLSLPGPLTDGYLRGFAGARRLNETD